MFLSDYFTRYEYNNDGFWIWIELDDGSFEVYFTFVVWQH